MKYCLSIHNVATLGLQQCWDTTWHWIDQFFAHWWELFIMEPYLDKSCYHPLFRWAINLSQLRFADMPQIFDRRYIRGVSRPIEDANIVLFKTSFGFSACMARCQILLENCVRRSFQLRDNPSFNQMNISIGIHHPLDWNETSGSLVWEAPPKHLLWWMFEWLVHVCSPNRLSGTSSNKLRMISFCFKVTLVWKDNSTPIFDGPVLITLGPLQTGFPHYSC